MKIRTAGIIFAFVVVIVAIVILSVYSVGKESENPVVATSTPVTTASENLPNVYQNTSDGFTLRYPAGYTVNESYTYQALGPGKDIHGVKFTVASSTTSGTNLSTDSYISVEEIPQMRVCSAELFVSSRAFIQNITDGNITYSVATSSEAAAGNRYEELVYALPGTNPCVAVRYLIHHCVFENYPAGTIRQFDRQALIDQFDMIRRTLVVNQ